jgi:hypothetical protein
LPYTSTKYKQIPNFLFNKRGYKQNYLKSQLYNFQIVSDAIKNNKVIVVLRALKDWYKAVPELEGKSYKVNSSLSAYPSRKNCPDGYPEIVIRLKKFQEIK